MQINIHDIEEIRMDTPTLLASGSYVVHMTIVSKEPFDSVEYSFSLFSDDKKKLKVVCDDC